MNSSSQAISVALEIGKKQIFASALDWPGWTRNGRDERGALESLLAYAPRYERAIHAAQLGFHAPTEFSALRVVERLPGNATTDFGAPDSVPAVDLPPLDDAALVRLQALIGACWETLQSTYQSAIGKELRKGPRGGGRELEKIINHVVDAHYAYLRSINHKAVRNDSGDILAVLDAVQSETHEGLSIAVVEGLPAHGPRGGAFWPVRYFVRRAAWHILDHVWEIEDRIQS